jgi:4-amino-4-deoxy-L-arabinose transferase-like glycosyltransferase
VEIAGWLVLAGVVLVAAWPPCCRTLGALTPAVDAAVEAGGWVRDRATDVPEEGLWLMTVAAGVLLLGACVGRDRGSATAVRSAAALVAFATAWVAAAAGRPTWAVIDGVLVALAVLTAADRQPQTTADRLAITVLPWIVVVAAVIRVWGLESLPPGFGTHGTTHLAVAVDLMDGARDALVGAVVPPQVWIDSGLPTAWTEQHGPLAAVHAVGFGLLGVGHVQARLTSALLGIATVWLLAVCGGWVGDRWLGVAAAGLLAVAPWHIAFSRGNDAEHVLSPLHAVLALGLTARALRRGRWVDWLAAGVAMGLSAYVYAPNQLVPLAGAVVVGVGAVTVPGVARRDARRIAVSAIVAMVVAAPHLAVWAASPVPVPIRSSVDRTPDGAYAVSRPDDLAPNLVESASQLLVRADDQWLSVPTGMVGPTTAAAWILGVCVCVAWLRRPRTRLGGLVPLSLLGVGLLPGVLSAWVFARRLVLAATAGELVAAAGVVALAGAVRRRRLPTPVWVAIVATATAVHTVTGMAVYVQTVEVPESLGSTTLPELARVVRTSLPEEPVVIAIAAGEPFLDVEDAIRIGAAPAVRPLVAAGYRRDDLWRVVTFDHLAEVLDELSAAGKVARVIVPAAGPGAVADPVLAALDGRGVGPPLPIIDVREVLVGWTWRVPAAGMPAAGTEITRDMPDSPGA